MFGASLGQSQPASGGLFGSSSNNAGTQQTGTGLFGSLGTNAGNQNQTGGIFGNLGQNNQQNQQQQGGGLFGGVGQNNQQNQQQPSGGLFGGLGLGSNNQNQPQQSVSFGGLGQNNQQQPSGLFGNLGQNNQNNQQQQQPTGLFGGLNMSQQQQQTQQQNGLLGTSTQQRNGLFGQSQQQQGLGQSQLQFNNSQRQPYEKSVQDQILTVAGKWDPSNPNCAFKYYFYNKVDENNAKYYGPAANEDPQAWEEALKKKPGPAFVPVLCTGYQQLAERIKTQEKGRIVFNAVLHQINDNLTALLNTHDTRTSIKVMEAKRKHVVLKQRCLALATKVQILRNRGYALNGDEEDVKIKLKKLEKGVNDPGLGARAEEIWARMISVQERGRLLRSELEKAGKETGEVLDEEMSLRAKKILEDYQTQLAHLKKELDAIQKDYLEWEKERMPAPAKSSPNRSVATNAGR